MPFVSMKCPSCGAALPPNAKREVVQCTFCGASVMYERWVTKRAEYQQAREAEVRAAALSVAPSLRYEDEIFAPIAHLGTGESSDVTLALRCDGPFERVVLKRSKSPACDELLEREWHTLRELFRLEVPGSHYLARLLPMPRRRLTRKAQDSADAVYFYAYQSGFFQTFEDVIAHYPAGVEPRTAVWMWRRVLEFLMFLHQAGYVHGALLPPHLLVHARDHGVLVVGFSMAQKVGTGPLWGYVEKYEPIYSRELLSMGELTPAQDLLMLARCIAYLLSGSSGAVVPSTVPAPIRALLEPYLQPSRHTLPTESARELHSLVGQAAARAFGPPQYHRFEMPGWK